MSNPDDGYNSVYKNTLQNFNFVTLDFNEITLSFPFPPFSEIYCHPKF